jgi:hypothetical protein
MTVLTHVLHCEFQPISRAWNILRSLGQLLGSINEN